MKQISIDESRRMSISSDDMNGHVPRVNNQIESGSTKKCIFGIIILGCLVLSILIALDVVSLKEIINIPGSNTNKENNQPNIQAQNQVSQENKKQLSSNQENKPVNSNQEKKEEEKKEEKKEEEKKEDEKKEEKKEEPAQEQKDENAPSA